MAELTTLDPVFEGLLREVASDPDSRLLRAPRSRDVPRWLSLDAPASANDMELGRAERELVRVGREELAWLFRQAALRELIDGESTRDEVIRGRVVDAKNQPIGREEIASRVVHVAPDATVDNQSLLAITRWIGKVNFVYPTAAALAAASMRIVPTGQARAIAGLDYVLHRNLASAESWLHASLLADGPGERALSTWNNLSFTYLLLGKLDRARAASLRAARIQPENLIARTGLLVTALLMEQEELIKTAARSFEILNKEPEEPVVQLASRLRCQRASRELVITGAASDMLRRNRVAAGTAERIFDELV